MNLKNKNIQIKKGIPIESKKQVSYDNLSHEEKIKKIKNDLQCGSYIVKSKEIADKMVQKIKEKVIFDI